MPVVDGVARWSADAAPSSAASSAPPDGASSSAWSRGARPSRGRLEDPPRLVGAEHALLAEHVAEPRPAVGRDARQLLVDDVPDVGLGAVRPGAELGRHGVGAEARRDDVDRALPAERVGDLEEPELGLEVEPVAGLRLDRRDAVAEHLVEPAPAVRQQRPRSSRRGSPRPSTGSRRRPRGCRGSRRPAGGGRSSSSREPANSRWVCGSTRPGRDDAAAGVEPREPGERVALGLERGLDAGRVGRRRRSGPPSRRRPAPSAAAGSADVASATRRPTSPCAGPAGRPPASVDDLGRADDRAGPGVGSSLRPPSMTRNVTPVTGGCAGRVAASEAELEGLQRREVAQPEVARRPPRAGRRPASSAARPAWSATARNAASGASPMSSDSARSTPSSAASVADRVPDQPERRDREVEQVHRDLGAGRELLDPEAVAPGPSAARRRTRGRGARSAWRGRRRRESRLML